MARRSAEIGQIWHWYKHLSHVADTRSMFFTIRIFQSRTTFCVCDKRTVWNIQLYSILLGFTLKISTTPWIWFILHYGLWASVFIYGLCACQKPQIKMQKKTCSGIVLHMHCGKKFELSSSLSMDVTRAELEILTLAFFNQAQRMPSSLNKRRPRGTIALCINKQNELDTI